MRAAHTKEPIVQVVRRCRRRPPAGRVVRNVVLEVLHEAEAKDGCVQVEIVFADDQTISLLNTRYLGRRGPTDVLSFDAGWADPETGAELLGSVVVGVETARRNALRMHIRIEEEILRCLAHGLLHLLGYDDRTPQDRSRMEKVQEKALELAGVRRRKAAR